MKSTRLAAATVFTAVLAMAETPAELNNRAVELYRQARYVEAERVYCSALDACREIPGGERQQAVVLNNLAVLYRTTARYQDALAAQEESVRQLRGIEGEGGPGAARSLTNLADLYLLIGKSALAELTAQEALAIHRANQDQGPDTALSMQVLALTRMELQRHASARGMLEEALAIRERTLGVSHPLTGSVWSSLAMLEMQAGEYAAAERAAQKALEIARASQAVRHPDTAACLNNLAQALRLQGRYLEAEHLYRQSIEILEATLGRDHPNTGKVVMNLAAFYHDRGREAGAEELYRRAHHILSRSLSPQHPATLQAASSLADVYRAEHRYSEAIELSRATLQEMEKALPGDDPRLRDARALYSQLVAEAEVPPRKRNKAAHDSRVH